jgi:hypothetical protein
VLHHSTDVNNITYRDARMTSNGASNKAFTWSGTWNYSATIGGGGRK